VHVRFLILVYGFLFSHFIMLHRRDVAYCSTCHTFHSLSLCWAHTWTVQKWLSRLCAYLMTDSCDPMDKWGAHWCHVVNITERSVHGYIVALCQITLTICFWLLIVWKLFKKLYIVSEGTFYCGLRLMNAY